jgi:mitochondrial fission protein ELM1
VSSAILCEAYAGLEAQARGLAEAAGLDPALRTLRARSGWRHIAPAWWPWPLAAVEPEALAPPLPPLLIGCGGKAASVLAALRGQVAARVIIQHPRLALERFDLVVAARHDGIAGRNVIVTRTALHRATPARMAAGAAAWRPRLAHLPRPLVGVLVGGSNGRFRLGLREAAALADKLARMMRVERVGVALTPSRRTAPAVTRHLADTLEPLGAWVHDLTGDNPYMGLLGLADLLVVTSDSVSMMSEAVATAAPVLVERLPGRSRRIEAFLAGLLRDGRVRPFTGRLDSWPVRPLDDTPLAAAEMRRRLGL